MFYPKTYKYWHQTLISTIWQYSDASTADVSDMILIA